MVLNFTSQFSTIIRKLGCCPYLSTWQKMRTFTKERTKDAADEIWLLQHTPVFTQGHAGKPEHILIPQDIPVIQTDRGGQITYHGPGQLIAYFLVNIGRHKIGIKKFVATLEKLIIDLLAFYKISGSTKEKAPGVYVANKKICSIGLKVSRGCTYHGIALNVNMDLTPFSHINPCGYPNLKMTQIADFIPNISIEDVQTKLHTLLLQD